MYWIFPFSFLYFQFSRGDSLKIPGRAPGPTAGGGKFVELCVQCKNSLLHPNQRKSQSKQTHWQTARQEQQLLQHQNVEEPLENEETELVSFAAQQVLPPFENQIQQEDSHHDFATCKVGFFYLTKIIHAYIGDEIHPGFGRCWENRKRIFLSRVSFIFLRRYAFE